MHTNWRSALAVCEVCGSFVPLTGTPAEMIQTQQLIAHTKPLANGMKTWTAKILKNRSAAAAEANKISKFLRLKQESDSSQDLAISLGRNNYWSDFHPENKAAG